MKHSHRLLCLVAAAIAVLGLARSGDRRLPPEDRTHLLSDKMTTVRSTGAIPTKGKAAFAALVGQTAFVMAEPDQPFQVGDSIAPGPPLPGRRLVFAAFDDALCVLHYERGGISHLYYVVAFGLEKGKDPTFRWGFRSDAKLADLSALREALAAGKLHDNSVNSW